MDIVSGAFTNTIDWDAHWAETDREDLAEMRAAGRRMAGRLLRYFGDAPASVLDVGCGPAFTLFALAERTDADLLGVDAAASVVRRNRRLAAERDLDVAFETWSLPDLHLGEQREFDCVTCVATLHYVAEIETAVARLYDHVASGGSLVFNYPNRYTRARYRSDPETDPDRFELVLRGENLLTHEDIERVLGRRPRSFWWAVGLAEWRSVGQTNPCVVVDRPQSSR